MFDNERYITCGISDRVPETLQIAIWSAIELQKSFVVNLTICKYSLFKKLVKIRLR